MVTDITIEYNPASGEGVAYVHLRLVDDWAPCRLEMDSVLRDLAQGEIVIVGEAK